MKIAHINTRVIVTETKPISFKLNYGTKVLDVALKAWKDPQKKDMWDIQISIDGKLASTLTDFRKWRIGLFSPREMKDSRYHSFDLSPFLRGADHPYDLDDPIVDIMIYPNGATVAGKQVPLIEET